MKKMISTVLALCLIFMGCAFSEPETPVYEKAMPLYEILLSSDTFYNFDGAPDAAMGREAVYRLRERYAALSEAISDEEAYRMIFAGGEYVPAEETETYLAPLPVKIQIESAVDSGIGTMIVTIRVEKDFGFGMELWGYADIHILPEETAPYGAYVTRVFIPE